MTLYLSFSDVIVADETVSWGGKSAVNQFNPLRNSLEHLIVRVNSEDCKCSFSNVKSGYKTISCVFQMRNVEDISL